MTYSPVYGSALGLLQLAVPSYALRLARSFGAQRVGWPIFTAFLCLALLHLAHAAQPAGALYPTELLLLYGAVPVMLLVGLGHVEAVSRERQRATREENTLRDKLQTQLRERTAELERTTEELHQEIARQREREETLKESAARYRFLFAENPQPMWLFDLRSMRFLEVNKAALRHYGYSQEEFMALCPNDLCVPPETASFVREMAKPCSGPQRRGVWRHRRKNGSLVEVQLTAVDLMYAGYPARLVLAQDLTEQREEQKRGLEVQRLEVMAELAGHAAEHVRQPLAVLEGYAGLLQREELTAVAEAYVERIADTLGQMRASNRQLLAVARRFPAETEALDLNRFLDQELRQLKLPKENIRLEKVFGSNLPPVVADPEAVRLILNALVNNACEAMRQGGTLSLRTEAVSIEQDYIRFRPDAKTGAFACVTLCDTGGGIHPKARARLFEPFFTTKDPATASGLGLAASFGLLKQQGGWMEVASSVGIGTTVQVFLPSRVA